MFGPGTKLFTILGFDVKLDFSWLFIATLIVWSLATSYFPSQIDDLPQDSYWAMGIIGMFGLFFSIIFHELAHSLVARVYGLEIKGITLFIFGGMAEMKNDPENATTEFMMAIAGPIASFVLAGAFYLTAMVGAVIGLGATIIAVAGYLAYINTILAIFNLIPAFPMDGGRVLRAILWHRMKDKDKATHIAARGGFYFGLALIGLGIFSVISGNFVSGLWAVLIGLFVQRAAAGEEFRSDISSTLGDQPVRDFMVTNPLTVDADMSIQDLVDKYFYRHHHDMFPVTSEGTLVGCITIRDVQNADRKNWQTTPLGTIMKPCNSDNTLDVDTPAAEAIALMNRANNGRMMVVENRQLVGILTLKDLLGVLTMKKQLQGTKQEKINGI